MIEPDDDDERTFEQRLKAFMAMGLSEEAARLQLSLGSPDIEVIDEKGRTRAAGYKRARKRKRPKDAQEKPGSTDESG